jgi:hypothetical protein
VLLGLETNSGYIVSATTPYSSCTTECYDRMSLACHRAWLACQHLLPYPPPHAKYQVVSAARRFRVSRLSWGWHIEPAPEREYPLRYHVRTDFATRPSYQNETRGREWTLPDVIDAARKSRS